MSFIVNHIFIEGNLCAIKLESLGLNSKKLFGLIIFIGKFRAPLFSSLHLISYPFIKNKKKLPLHLCMTFENHKMQLEIILTITFNEFTHTFFVCV